VPFDKGPAFAAKKNARQSVVKSIRRALSDSVLTALGEWGEQRKKSKQEDGPRAKTQIEHRGIRWFFGEVALCARPCEKHQNKGGERLRNMFSLTSKRISSLQLMKSEERS
jgi:hypothetical protein